MPWLNFLTIGKDAGLKATKKEKVEKLQPLPPDPVNIIVTAKPLLPQPDPRLITQTRGLYKSHSSSQSQDDDE